MVSAATQIAAKLGAQIPPRQPYGAAGIASQLSRSVLNRQSATPATPAATPSAPAATQDTTTQNPWDVDTSGPLYHPDISDAPPGWTVGAGMKEDRRWWDALPEADRQKIWDEYLKPQREKDKMTHYTDYFHESANKLGQDFQNAQGTPEDINRYYSEMSSPIESNFYNQANQVSSYLARQGLGSSGMNLGAHAELETNRSALEGQAKKSAIDAAIQKEREGLLGNFQMQMGGLQPELQKYGIDTSAMIAQMQMQMQMEMLKKQMDAQRSSGWGSLVGGLAGLGIGSMFGAPMVGASIGSGVGGNLGS